MALSSALSIFHHHRRNRPFWSYCHFFAVTILVAYSLALELDDDSDDSAGLLMVQSSTKDPVGALLKFKSSVKDPSGALSSWIASSPPCTAAHNYSSWAGVICYHGSVWGLQLEHMGLEGQIDVDALWHLPSLRALSFMNNSFQGPIPAINRLGALKALYLSHNTFSGEIPDGTFDGMMSLKKLHLAHNQFTGKIPESLARLPRLVELKMESNQLTGPIPDFKQKLQVINLSGNSLEGPIPASLSKLDPSSFSGNKALCDAPLAPCSGSSLIESTTSPSGKGPANHTAIIVVAIVLALALLLVLIVLVLRRRGRNGPSSSPETPAPPNLRKKTSLKDAMASRQGSPDHSGSSKKTDTKLSFVRDDGERFDLQDLLKASAEILGSGCFGSSYKAALTSGTMMVVKRFRQMNNVGKEEFQEHMRRLGRLSHPNLLPLVAYYYRKEEKLLVSEFVSQGSLAIHLHSNRAQGGQPALDWPTRLKIVKGVAKGLSYLYSELPTLMTPHGHLKSSNVLLNDSFDPLLNDYGLVPVINQESSRELMVAFKSPEYLHSTRVTKKTDVWSLGILILEILTGKFPANFLQKGKSSDQDQDQDLARWVEKVEGSTEAVFDREMNAPASSEGEMTKLLKIGMSCCEVDVERRIELKDAVEKIEEVKEKDADEDFYSSYASEADVRSSRGLSEDFTRTN